VHVILARDEKCYLADTGLLDKPALSRRHNVSPVEVKSGSNLTHSSMDKFARKFKECLSERFMIYDKDVSTGAQGVLPTLLELRWLGRVDIEFVQTFGRVMD